MILPIEQQFAAPELCKRLMELGAPRDSAMLWLRWIDGRGKIVNGQNWELTENDNDWPGTPMPLLHIGDDVVEELVPAFSVAELGVLLRGYAAPEFNFGKAGFGLWDKGEDLYPTPGRTEADARILLVIHHAERLRMRALAPNEEMPNGK